MTMKSGIMFIKRVKKGTGLSYGLTYTTERDSFIATIPVGYADGYPRALSNKAKVIINGKTYPVVGRICMDQCLIELGDDIYPIGQEVTLFGTHTITAQDVADWCDTIPYEITCNMSRRVPRMYL
jgi:alanine racemase